MKYFAYKTTTSLGRVDFSNGRALTQEEERAARGAGSLEMRGPFDTRDEALDEQLRWEGKPTWAEQEAAYASCH